MSGSVLLVVFTSDVQSLMLRKSSVQAKGDRIISGSVVNLQGAESKGHHILVVPKEDFGTG